MRRVLTNRTMFLTRTGAMLALFVAVGCGAGEVKTVPAEGTVMLGKEPLKSGTITFHPDTTKGNSTPQPAVGNVENGKYKVAIGSTFGAPPGWYKVTVSASAPSDPKDEYSVPKSLVNDQFVLPEHTPLTVEVKDGGGPYDFKVTK